MAGSGIDFELLPVVGGFRKRWVFVDVGVRSPCSCFKLTNPRLAHVWRRLTRLKDLGVTAPMVVKEFIRRCIAPLQRRSRPMWAFPGSKDRMRLHEPGLPLEAQQTMLELLTSDPLPDNILEEGCLLY